MTHALLIAVIALAVLAPGIDASGPAPQTAPPSAQPGPLRFSLDPLDPPVPGTASPDLAASNLSQARDIMHRLVQQTEAMTKGTGNCGMPVLPASPEVDRRMLREPEPGVAFSIQHAPPRICGR